MFMYMWDTLNRGAFSDELFSAADAHFVFSLVMKGCGEKTP